jgi:hypothetical protein
MFRIRPPVRSLNCGMQRGVELAIVFMIRCLYAVVNPVRYFVLFLLELTLDLKRLIDGRTMAQN